MVQEITAMETPSPQTVGLHFVHQYYTMLNKAPEYLHRFYNTNSLFLRGGLDSAGKLETTVQGQQAIHEKVMELNFRDCHTKIIMVDSQATIGEGVVIQVSGELSNDGQPLRRFMQTFVLALQSPKQYYCLNDILRYQDDVFPDDDENDLQEESGDIENEDVHADVGDATSNIQDASLSHYYGQHTLNNGTTHPHLENPMVMVPATVQPAAVPASVPIAVAVVHPVVAAAATVHPAAVPPPMIPPSVSTAPPVVAVQAAVLAPVIVPQQQQQQQQQQPVMDEPEPLVNNSASPSSAALTKNQEYAPPSKDLYNTEKAPSKSPELQDNNLIESSANKPRTYATMVSKKTSPSNTSPNLNHSMGASTTNTTTKTAPFVPTLQPSTRPDYRSTDGYSNSFVPPQPQRPPPPRSKPMIMRGGSTYSTPPRDRVGNSRGTSEEPGEYDRSRPSGPMFPDSQQVFVGNLPLDMNEEELREVFSKFGTVMDVRIQSKYGSKTTVTGRQMPVPNYGFVAFDDVSAVKHVLSEKVVHCRNNQRLNVEEKINRGRTMYGGSGGGGDPRTGMPRMGGNSNRGGGPHMGGGRGSRGGMMMGGMSRGGNGMGGGGRGGYSQGPNRDRRQ